MSAAAAFPDPEAADLAAQLVARYTADGRTLATAESLTGGLLGATVTAVPGASAVYRGGLITYATDVKGSLGQVPAEILRAHGAVSEPTVRHLAAAARAHGGADIGIALSGVAGPTAQEGHAPGTVWLGWSAVEPGAALLHLPAPDRTRVRVAAVVAALTRLLDL